MKYNILTVSNEVYSPFLKLFVASYFDKISFENVNKIYIFDTGLSADTIGYLEKFPKVFVVETNMSTTSKEIHDDGWKKNTYSKTKFLLSILQKDRIPTFMVDVDSIFVKSFEDIIDWDCDFVACKRNREGFSKHIGSFFGALNVEKSCDFILKWVDNIEYLKNNTSMKHCESPALSKTIEEHNNNIQFIEEQIISAVFPDKSSRIYHLKSDHYAMTVESRMQLPHAKSFVLRYL
tara:strand:+ start:294 stop:998 length:705 start_codon:yes stop_codon:yes gene_type:complete